MTNVHELCECRCPLSAAVKDIKGDINSTLL